MVEPIVVYQPEGTVGGVCYFIPANGGVYQTGWVIDEAVLPVGAVPTVCTTRPAEFPGPILTPPGGIIVAPSPEPAPPPSPEPAPAPIPEQPPIPNAFNPPSMPPAPGEPLFREGPGGIFRPAVQGLGSLGAAIGILTLFKRAKGKRRK